MNIEALKAWFARNKGLALAGAGGVVLLIARRGSKVSADTASDIGNDPLYQVTPGQLPSQDPGSNADVLSAYQQGQALAQQSGADSLAAYQAGMADARDIAASSASSASDGGGSESGGDSEAGAALPPITINIPPAAIAPTPPKPPGKKPQKPPQHKGDGKNDGKKDNDKKKDPHHDGKKKDDSPPRRSMPSPALMAVQKAPIVSPAMRQTFQVTSAYQSNSPVGQIVQHVSAPIRRESPTHAMTPQPTHAAKGGKK